MRYLLLLCLLVFTCSFFAVGCNSSQSGKENKGDEITETSKYQNGTVMIRDNASYRDYGKTSESFDSVIQSEKENVDVGPKEIQFGQE